MTRRTDSEILGWLMDNVDYLEHIGDGGYWPQLVAVEKYDFTALNLREYVEARMDEAKP